MNIYLMDAHSAGNILLIWLGRVGDFVISTPFIAAMRRKYPGAEITMFVTDPVAKLAAMAAGLDKTVILPSLKRPLSFFRFLKSWSRSKFDICVDLNSSYSRISGFFSLLSLSPERISFDKFRAGWFYTATVPAPPDNEHMLERYRRLAGYFGAPYEPVMKITPGPENELKAERLILSQNIDKNKFIVALHPGNFKKFDHRWPEEKFIELSRRILSGKNTELVYITGPGEESEIAGMLKLLPAGVKKLPPLPIEVMAALLKRVDLFVVSATGTMHLAAAAGAPVLSFHSSYTYACWRPLTEKGISLDSGDWTSCRSITVDQAWEAFNKLAGRASKA